jgi:hypothetical protein
MAVSMSSKSWARVSTRTPSGERSGLGPKNGFRMEIQAVLYAETDNPYDDNAISVWINGMKVGHLAREDAAAYRPGLLALQAREGKSIALGASSSVVVLGRMCPAILGCGCRTSRPILV